MTSSVSGITFAPFVSRCDSMVHPFCLFYGPLIFVSPYNLCRLSFSIISYFPVILASPLSSFTILASHPSHTERFVHYSQYGIRSIPSMHHPPPPQLPSALPGVSYSKASPLSDALVDHQLAEEPRGAPWGKFRGRGAPFPSHHTRGLGGFQFQMHVLLECPNAGVHLNTQLV